MYRIDLNPYLPDSITSPSTFHLLRNACVLVVLIPVASRVYVQHLSPRFHHDQTSVEPFIKSTFIVQKYCTFQYCFNNTLQPCGLPSFSSSPFRKFLEWSHIQVDGLLWVVITENRPEALPIVSVRLWVIFFL